MFLSPVQLSKFLSEHQLSLSCDICVVRELIAAYEEYFDGNTMTFYMIMNDYHNYAPQYLHDT